MEQSPSDEILKTAIRVSAARLRRQHELAAEYGFASLRMPDMDQVLAEATRVVCLGLGTRFAKVLRYMPADHDFLLEAGAGWDSGEIGATHLGADDASPAGYAFSSGQPVISNHLSSEERFRTPALLAKYGMQRAINVIIRGIPEPYGVLEGDSADGDDFTEVDIVFMEAIANVIAFARERITIEAEGRRGDLLSASVLNSSIDCIKVMSAAGNVQFMNENGLRQMEIDHFSQVDGKHWTEIWPAQEREKIDDALRRARLGETVRFEAGCPTAKGKPRWWDISVAPIREDNGMTERIMAVARDITERRRSEEALSELISQKEHQLGTTQLMMQEVHHRVRNSLQLVQTLLALQSTLAIEPHVKSHLQAAAVRVMTVGSVHARLYQDTGASATDASQYLEGLIHDLRGCFADREVDRSIHLVAEPMIVPAARLTPLGLITAELVTNSLKYGKGNITVALTRVGDAMQLTVDDEGAGFPENFPAPHGTGLGMRLVQTYARGLVTPVRVDRSVPFSRIIITLSVN